MANRKAIAFLLAMAMLFSMVMSTTNVAYAATNVNRESLITNVTNPSNGKISFNLNVPAGVSVTYKVELIPNQRTGSIDTMRGSYKNTGRSQVTRNISVTSRYYSNKYTITASYSTGPAKSRTNYSDVDNATSALKTAVTTNKFVWTSENISKWKAGQRIGIGLSFAITGTVDLFVTKGYLSGALATALSLTLFAGDLIAGGTVADTKNIALTPIARWGYQFKLVPYSGGYEKILVVLDAYGRQYQTVSWGRCPITSISLAAR